MAQAYELLPDLFFSLPRQFGHFPGRSLDQGDKAVGERGSIALPLGAAFCQVVPRHRRIDHLHLPVLFLTLLTEELDRLPGQMGQEVAAAPQVLRLPGRRDEGLDGSDADDEQLTVHAFTPSIWRKRFRASR